ncbi:hypothetical protein GGR88_002395 [Sphingomonas jejuensis]|uniref:Lipoprotein n=1 Tax=Sphingomonas jejuensis TaxID=904715 RepID=A0ABX0XQA4_9SPHN|nr:hypothetical protein [Sphingomonas jejuensis]NJC34881.1 hypothetical protein [Sphingomonas jejuensis]
MHRSVSYMLVASASLASCSPPPSGEQPADRAPAKIFSAQDRATAQKLSLSSASAPQAGTAQDQALACEFGLDALGTRLRSSGLLSAEQERVYAQAQALYRRRATEGLSPDEAAVARQNYETAQPDTNARARIGLSCLRQLI